MQGGMFALVLGAMLLAAPHVSADEAEPPCPAYEMRTFVVYFWPEPEMLSPEAREVIEALANFYVESQSPTSRCWSPMESIQLVGYTDTAGESRENLGLSQRRVQMVADELVRRGVPREVISMEAKGEAEPIVQTGDNVREPLNNRVTMDPVF